jgi:hypothetical protein
MEASHMIYLDTQSSKKAAIMIAFDTNALIRMLIEDDHNRAKLVRVSDHPG